jgi:hypothetical protein
LEELLPPFSGLINKQTSNQHEGSGKKGSAESPCCLLLDDCLAYSFTLKMEAVWLSEMSVNF